MPRIEFDVALNIRGLSPKDVGYWTVALVEILKEMACIHGVGINGWLGAYVTQAGANDRNLFLFARELDLNSDADLGKYREVETKLRAAIEKHSKG